jgi:hypothetical protein
VQPLSTYVLSGFYRIDRLEGAGGVQWEVFDTGNKSLLNQGVLLNQIGEWQSFEETFKTGESTELIRLRLVRVPSRDVLEGKLWIDDMALVRRTEP